MPTQNLPAGAVKDVMANEIGGIVHVYRTPEGYETPGQFAWSPNGGEMQIHSLEIGHTISFKINGAVGSLANGCASVVELVWDNAPAVAATNVMEYAAKEILEALGAKAGGKS
jgi:hypothetical protein